MSYFRQLHFSSLGPISLYKFLMVKEPWWSVYGDLGAFGPTCGHMAQNLWTFGLVIITEKGHIREVSYNPKILMNLRFFWISWSFHTREAFWHCYLFPTFSDSRVPHN